MNDGGPAFPWLEETKTSLGGAGTQHFGYAGMSLRDYFAAKAMQAFISRTGTINNKLSIEDYEYAQFAYRLADCMVAEREKAK